MKQDNKVIKIDVEELIGDFKVSNKEAFQVYLKELWKDLSQRTEDKSKGISRVTFSKYYNLPGIIFDRLFNVFDANKNDYLDSNEFVEGMSTLFSENYDKLIKFIFNFYDFNNDGFVSKEDIRTVLSYVPLNTINKSKGQKLKYENEDYKDRIESQDEIYSILESCFEKKVQVDFKSFANIVENVNSDFFLFILIFLLEKRPFTRTTLEAYSTIAPGSKIPEAKSTKMIASPNLRSKFSPSITIQKSPSQMKKTLDTGGKIGSMNVLNKFIGKNPLSGNSSADPKEKLQQYMKSGSTTLKETKEELEQNKNNPTRKKRDNLKNLEENLSRKNVIPKEHDDNVPLMDAKKYEKQGLVNIQNEDGY